MKIVKGVLVVFILFSLVSSVYGLTIEIKKPSDGSCYNYRDSIYFSGLLSPWNITANYNWSSSIDGDFNQNSLTFNSTKIGLTLSPGIHKISLTAKAKNESQGADSDSINITMYGSVYGDISDVNTNFGNLSLDVNGSADLFVNLNGNYQCAFKNGSLPLLEFYYNFSNLAQLNLSDIYINDSSDSSIGATWVKGFNATANTTKTIYLKRINSSLNGICIKDSDVSSISNVSAGCNESDETKVDCDKTLQNGYRCSYNSTSGYYRVTGLNHSAVKQIEYSAGSVIGSLDNINTNLGGINISINGSGNLSKSFNDIQTVIFKNSSQNILEFDFNFSNFNKLNLSRIMINESSNSSIGRILIRLTGITITNKTAYLKRINDSINGICIKDADVTSIDNISSECNESDEIKTECDGSLQDGYRCSYNSTSGYYRITGLNHSAIKQINYEVPSSSTGRTGGGSSSCTENWQCAEWGECSKDGIQTRDCTDSRNCGTSKNKPDEEQSCVFACKEIWACGEWSECSKGRKTRECYKCDKIKTEEKTCESCDDRIQNQDEEGIDCGGPCEACVIEPEESEEKPEDKAVPLQLGLIGLIMMGILALLIFAYEKRENIEEFLLKKEINPYHLHHKLKETYELIKSKEYKKAMDLYFSIKQRYERFKKKSRNLAHKEIHKLHDEVKLYLMAYHAHSMALKGKKSAKKLMHKIIALAHKVAQEIPDDKELYEFAKKQYNYCKGKLKK
jgi:hypothetical protein